MKKKILIVDDEERVVHSMVGVLEDEGFQVVTARNGEEALQVFKRENPEVTLLDIWMPGMDGIEVLKHLKSLSDKPVIMISGHATISTAMTAVKLGAFDFIEKPLSLDTLLATIHRALERRSEPSQVEPLEGLSRPQEISHPSLSPEERVPYSQKRDEKSIPSLFPQRTIRQSVVLYGTGLHSGMKTGLLLQPLPPNHGILFGSLSSDEVVPAHLDYVQTTDYATSLKRGRAVAKTIEHLMAVFHAYRITNVMVKMIEEIPIMDGSALEFCKIIEEAGIEEQEERVEEFVVERRLEIIHQNKSLTIEPSETFSIQYFLDYPPPIGKQSFDFVLENEEAFKKEIAPARTFGFLKDIEMLERMGLGSGGRLHNFILVDEEKVVNTELRFEDEFVRHKILDILGDFYLLNRPIRGKVTARYTGHTENIAMMRKIKEEILRREG
jgi:UDP-3-O-acyl N-acetylglucosamine deacetylase